MSETPPFEPHDRSVAPPVAPIARAVPSPPSSWPNVLGVLCIVFGGLATLGSILGALSPLYNQGLKSLMPAEQAAVMEAGEELAPYTVASALFTIAVAILLLAGGIGLLRRRGGAVGLLKVWAVLKILLVVVTTFVGVWTQREVLKLVQEQTGGGSVPGMEMFLTVGVAVGVILSVLWGWALPVFVLIWFSRKMVRDDVAAWR